MRSTQLITVLPARCGVSGTRERIADLLKAYADAGVTTLIVAPGGAAHGGPGPTLDERLTVVRTVAEAAELAHV
jgi:hypothetical protein